MRRSFFATFVAITAVVALVGSSLAGRGWCRSDPIVRIGNTTVQIWVAIPAEDETSVTGPIAVALTVPRGVPHATLLQDPGFNGTGEAITWIEQGNLPPSGLITVIVVVRVPIAANRAVPMQVEVIPQVGNPVYVLGQSTGAILTITLNGDAIANTSAVGASVTGASATASSGQSATGESATGASVSGTSSTPYDLPTTEAQSEPAIEATPEAGTPEIQGESSLAGALETTTDPVPSENQPAPDLVVESEPEIETEPEAASPGATPVVEEAVEPVAEQIESETTNDGIESAPPDDPAATPTNDGGDDGDPSTPSPESSEGGEGASETGSETGASEAAEGSPEPISSEPAVTEESQVDPEATPESVPETEESNGPPAVENEATQEVPESTVQPSESSETSGEPEGSDPPPSEVTAESEPAVEPESTVVPVETQETAEPSEPVATEEMTPGEGGEGVDSSPTASPTPSPTPTAEPTEPPSPTATASPEDESTPTPTPDAGSG